MDNSTYLKKDFSFSVEKSFFSFDQPFIPPIKLHGSTDAGLFPASIGHTSLPEKGPSNAYLANQQKMLSNSTGH